MSLFDVFLPKPAAPTAPATPNGGVVTPPGNMENPNQVPVATPNTDPNGVVPPTPVAPAEPNSPLDQYKSLWDTAPIDPNVPTNEYTPSQLKPEDVNKAVSNADFSAMLTPENLAAIAQGGEGAQQAFIASLNSVGQQVLAQSTLVSNKLISQEVTKALEAQKAGIPDLVRQHSVTETVADSNPIFKDPAVQPIIAATRSQLAKQNPTASATEIAEMTNNYVLALAQTFSPKAAVAPDINEVDWDKFLT